jgi:hypothetical protein
MGKLPCIEKNDGQNGQDFYAWAKKILVQESTNNVIKIREKNEIRFFINIKIDVRL